MEGSTATICNEWHHTQNHHHHKPSEHLPHHTNQSSTILPAQTLGSSPAMIIPNDDDNPKILTTCMAFINSYTNDDAMSHVTTNVQKERQHQKYQQQQKFNLFHKRYPYFSSSTENDVEFSTNDRASKRPRLVSYHGDSFSVHRGVDENVDDEREKEEVEEEMEDMQDNDDDEEESIPTPKTEHACTKKDKAVDMMIHELEERLENLTSNADGKSWCLTGLKSWRRNLTDAIPTQVAEEEGMVSMEIKKKQYQQPWLKKQGGHDTIVRQRRKEARRHLIRLTKRNDEVGTKR